MATSVPSSRIPCPKTTSTSERRPRNVDLGTVIPAQAGIQSTAMSKTSARALPQDRKHLWYEHVRSAFNHGFSRMSTDEGGFIRHIRVIRGCVCIKVAIIAPCIDWGQGAMMATLRASVVFG